MEFQQLEALTRLQRISITEIVFGILNIGTAIWLLIKIPNEHIWPVVVRLLFDIFLMVTGSLGVLVVKKSRQGAPSQRLFFLVGAFNIILCILYSCAVVLCIAIGVLFIWSPYYLKVALDKVAEWLGTSPEGPHSSQLPGGTPTTAQNVNVIVFVVLVVLISVICIFVLICAILTAAAGRISRRNATILEADPVTIPPRGPAKETNVRVSNKQGYRSISDKEYKE
ncbi:uncharacterized protein LOC129583902 [Paramacrobiotus metropolitanus]|uniref:uncharacterized protein LOC129583902 n=1 Tax=Paramacrobiotus metropolitanus TaxID=2943436 RepID=UPI00244592BE|nr:uncharacterized protein LOC129583902 [Paramacrobiotus metropolitanus]XP_055331908.1 uncharacterized protein LOC129583902 [Paramacrobiotus metropolitanus]XP_055331909.1 uncharacterized protein LOC129583902 [Paramacrobiotus metropolitanus]XP_055331910.1 uncharacterized protein LOC129583902 [Paramacrobiotus metropolitanus]XP_055331911.1 uncharacterized protein LOC129583902 [Paramacrobiotus metropolitanus]XP_055331912.1 uncharacterized protein LOC129583902 [Paramacrobiotus metropolitanus]